MDLIKKAFKGLYLVYKRAPYISYNYIVLFPV